MFTSLVPRPKVSVRPFSQKVIQNQSFPITVMGEEDLAAAIDEIQFAWDPEDSRLWDDKLKRVFPLGWPEGSPVRFSEGSTLNLTFSSETLKPDQSTNLLVRGDANSRPQGSARFRSGAHGCDCRKASDAGSRSAHRTGSNCREDQRTVRAVEGHGVREGTQTRRDDGDHPRSV